MIFCDFETKSACDLKTAGVYNYAQHGTTEVLCMAYAIDDGEVQLWTEGPLPDFAGHQIRAHNAAFERLIFWYVLQQDYPLDQFYCTAAQARANCAPGSLEDAGRFAGASMRKDHRGGHLVRQCCLPPYNTALLPELYAYCKQDVRAMRAISKGMRGLSDDELMDYHINERINDRGVLVDVALAQSAIRYASAELEEIQTVVAEVTGGAVTSVRSPKMRQWVQDRVTYEQLALMMVEDKVSIDKSVRANLLACDDLDPSVREVVQSADDLWASSVAKFSRMAALADEEDHRVRGAFVFNGGAATGRLSSYGLQVHNFTRKCAKAPQVVRDAMVADAPIVPAYGKRVTDVLKGMLRPALIPAPGKQFVVADWSGIEARCNPWLSGSGDEVLAVFRAGRDIYIREAASIFRCDEADVTPDMRQVGKVAILSCFGRDTRVLTDNGVKAIVEVTLDDLLWDGVEWVKHQGLIAQGQQLTLSVAGVTVTPEHQFLTPSGWTAAAKLGSNKNTLRQALATGLENLPSLALSASHLALARRSWLALNVLAAPLHIWSTFTTYAKVRLHGVTLAPRSSQGIGQKTIGGMLTFAPMIRIAADCCAGYLRASTDATTPTIQPFNITAAEASMSLNFGGQTAALSWPISSLWTGGISPNWNLTGLMSMAGMRRAIFGLSLGEKICSTSGKLGPCKTESLSLRPVFDILNSGPRARFTILSDSGPLIVHNCGYGGSVGAFAAMGRNYGVNLPEADARRTVNAWRQANPWAVRYWQALESAYMRAMRNKGKEFTAGRVTYLFDGVHLWYALPSGRVLCYPHARFEPDGVSYAKCAWKPAQDAIEWPRARLWSGLAAENICQAVANDLLRHSLRQVDDVVLTIHDEILLECPIEKVHDAMENLKRIMCTPPDWCKELPLSVDIKIMSRYGK
jgi:DNA polymerase